MKNNEDKKHESYGMIRVSKFTSNHSEFYGSDIIHNGGVQLEISRGSYQVRNGHKYYHSDDELIRINLSNSQYVDMITSAMNTQGVPCTLLHTENNRMIEQISHVEDKIETFRANMEDTQKEYRNRIDNIIEKLSTGTLGKKKTQDLVHDLNVLKDHIKSNTPYVLECFEEEMEASVTEAKHSISHYVDTKVQSLGIEHLRDEMMVSIEPNERKELE